MLDIIFYFTIVGVIKSFNLHIKKKKNLNVRHNINCSQHSFSLTYQPKGVTS